MKHSLSHYSLLSAFALISFYPIFTMDQSDLSQSTVLKITSEPIPMERGFTFAQKAYCFTYGTLALTEKMLKNNEYNQHNLDHKNMLVDVINYCVENKEINPIHSIITACAQYKNNGMSTPVYIDERTYENMQIILRKEHSNRIHTELKKNIETNNIQAINTTNEYLHNIKTLVIEKILDLEKFKAAFITQQEIDINLHCEQAQKNKQAKSQLSQQYKKHHFYNKSAGSDDEDVNPNNIEETYDKTIILKKINMLESIPNTLTEINGILSQLKNISALLNIVQPISTKTSPAPNTAIEKPINQQPTEEKITINIKPVMQNIENQDSIQLLQHEAVTIEENVQEIIINIQEETIITNAEDTEDKAKEVNSDVETQ